MRVMALVSEVDSIPLGASTPGKKMKQVSSEGNTICAFASLAGVFECGQDRQAAEIACRI